MALTGAARFMYALFTSPVGHMFKQIDNGYRSVQSNIRDAETRQSVQDVQKFRIANEAEANIEKEKIRAYADVKKEEIKQSSAKKKRTPQKVPAQEERCQCRKTTGEQCTRKRKGGDEDGNEFCKQLHQDCQNRWAAEEEEDPPRPPALPHYDDDDLANVD